MTNECLTTSDIVNALIIQHCADFEPIADYLNYILQKMTAEAAGRGADGSRIATHPLVQVLSFSLFMRTHVLEPSDLSPTACTQYVAALQACYQLTAALASEAFEDDEEELQDE